MFDFIRKTSVPRIVLGVLAVLLFAMVCLGTVSAADSGGANESASADEISFIDKLYQGFITFTDKLYQNFIEKNRYLYIITGLTNTLIITFFALILGMALGALIAIIRTVHDLHGRLKFPNAVCKIYLAVIRGTPVMLQLLIIYFVVFAAVDIDKILVAVVAFGLNSAAYVAEIIRAGINAVPKGQFEAGSSLGLPFSITMLSIILPQAIKNILPALCNEGIVLLKETAICGYIGLVDLTKAGDIIRSQTFEAFIPLVGVGLIYLVLVLILTALVQKLERRLNKNAS